MPIRSQDLQQRMLKALGDQAKLLSAYDLFAQLGQFYERLALNAACRSLNKLMQAGKMHRLESVSGYIPCDSGHHDHIAIMSICNDSGNVQECENAEFSALVAGIIKAAGFLAGRHLSKVHGQCHACRD